MTRQAACRPLSGFLLRDPDRFDDAGGDATWGAGRTATDANEQEH